MVTRKTGPNDVRRVVWALQHYQRGVAEDLTNVNTLALAFAASHALSIYEIPTISCVRLFTSSSLIGQTKATSMTKNHNLIITTMSRAGLLLPIASASISESYLCTLSTSELYSFINRFLNPKRNLNHLIVSSHPLPQA